MHILIASFDNNNVSFLYSEKMNIFFFKKKSRKIGINFPNIESKQLFHKEFYLIPKFTIVHFFTFEEDTKISSTFTRLFRYTNVTNRKFRIVWANASLQPYFIPNDTFAPSWLNARIRSIDRSRISMYRRRGRDTFNDLNLVQALK